MYSCNISVQRYCERGGTHKKNIINVKYNSNVQMMTIYDNNLFLIL